MFMIMKRVYINAFLQSTYDLLSPCPLAFFSSTIYHAWRFTSQIPEADRQLT